MSSKLSKMRCLPSRLFRKLGNGFHRVALWTDNLGQQKNSAIKKWLADNGDKTLRLYYEDLHKNSLVFDIGGYQGQWTSDIYSIYRCKIHVFEPVEEFANNIKRRFFQNTDIMVHQFGLSDRNITIRLALDKDSTSAFKFDKEFVDAQFIEVAKFVADNGIKFIDLVKVNIEGGEYDLLEHLLKIGLIRNMKNIQIQFHDFIPDAMIRMREIQRRLSVTHELTYQHVFVWENWRLRE